MSVHKLLLFWFQLRSKLYILAVIEPVWGVSPLYVRESFGLYCARMRPLSGGVAKAANRKGTWSIGRKSAESLWLAVWYWSCNSISNVDHFSLVYACFLRFCSFWTSSFYSWLRCPQVTKWQGTRSAKIGYLIVQTEWLYLLRHSGPSEVVFYGLSGNR